jgi:uncharacterized membrane protein YqiK
VAKAELAARYKPSNEALHDSRVAKAEADHEVATERCDDKAGNEKDICVKEAKAAKFHIISDADAQLKTAQANAEATEKTGEAKSDAKKDSAEARQDAASEKSDADYSVAFEKCDKLAGDAKDRCVSAEKKRFDE